jgi:plasmid stability protein
MSDKPPRRLLEYLRKNLPLRRRALHAESAWLGWLPSFVRFQGPCRMGGLGAPEVTAARCWLATVGKVAAGMRNQALQALRCLCPRVLEARLRRLGAAARPEGSILQRSVSLTVAPERNHYGFNGGSPMPTTLTLKNIPDEVYDRLRISAEAHRRSLNSEAIVCLESVLLPRRMAVSERLARARALRASLPKARIRARDIDDFKREGRR